MALIIAPTVAAAPGSDGGGMVLGLLGLAPGYAPWFGRAENFPDEGEPVQGLPGKPRQGPLRPIQEITGGVADPPPHRGFLIAFLGH